MKRLFPLLCLISLVSCTKTLDTPFSSSNDTSEDRARRLQVAVPQDSTFVYTFNYVGTPDASFTATFPPFKVISGILSSWKVDIVRKINGVITLSNQLSTRNDSAINILRYSSINVADTPFVQYPDNVVQRIKQGLRANQTINFPINTVVSDGFNSGLYGSLTVYSNEATDVSFYIRELITPFKSNCVTMPYLTDSTTVTLTYYYQPDHRL